MSGINVDRDETHCKTNRCVQSKIYECITIDMVFARFVFFLRDIQYLYIIYYVPSTYLSTLFWNV